MFRGSVIDEIVISIVEAEWSNKNSDHGSGFPLTKWCDAFITSASMDLHYRLYILFHQFKFCWSKSHFNRIMSFSAIIISIKPWTNQIKGFQPRTPPICCTSWEPGKCIRDSEMFGYRIIIYNGAPWDWEWWTLGVADSRRGGPWEWRAVTHQTVNN